VNLLDFKSLSHLTGNGEMTSFIKKINIQCPDENVVFILIFSKKKDVIFLSITFLHNTSYSVKTED